MSTYQCDAQRALAQKVKEMRVERKMSQHEVAKLAGLHRTFVARFERTAGNLQISNIAKLAKGLGVDPLRLFADNPDAREQGDELRARVVMNLKRLRKACAISQEALSEKAGFSVSYIGRVEAMNADVTLKNLARIASALDADLSELFAPIEHS